MRAAPTLTLLLVSAGVLAQARLLLQTQQQCDASASTWNYYSCYAATGMTPPGPPSPPVTASEGPPEGLPQQQDLAFVSDLPPRWGGDDPNAPGQQGNTTDHNNTTDTNPFLARDPAPPPLVRSAQGGSISGGSSIGFRTGGAQDVENFRENIKAGYLPLPTDVTFEGIVKDYYFDTASPNASQPCTELFCPIYSLALSPDPLRAAAAARRRRLQAASRGTAPEPEVHLAVGLDSGMQASDFKRKKLNLVLLLDVSGSMGERFNSYYYDSLGKQQNLTSAELNATKIDVAKEVLSGILDLLAAQDSFAIVLFSDSACTPKPFGPVSCADIPGLKAQASRHRATKQLKSCQQCMSASLADTENRIILITDQQPNVGDLTTEGLSARLQHNAQDNIFTTIIGVGLDFNSELIEGISKVRGTNYYSVHTPGEFQRRLVQDFDYAVTPLVFDLTLSVDPGSLSADGDSSGWKMLHVYGSRNPNTTALSSNGTIMQVNTLFPSPKTEEGIKGGVVLLRMAPPAGGSNRPLQLTVTYTDRERKTFSSKRTVAMPPEFKAAASSGSGAPHSYYQSSGVEKAVLLARYTDLLHDWLIDEWAHIDQNKTVVVNATLCSAFPSDFCPSVDANQTYGINTAPKGCKINSWLAPDACLLPVPFPIAVQLGQWERLSHELTASAQAQQAFEVFLPYLKSEMAAVNDTTLQQEVDLMNQLIALP